MYLSRLTLALPVVALSACAQLGIARAPAPAPAPVVTTAAAPATAATTLGSASAVAAAQLDTTTPAQKAAAAAPAAASQKLGTTIASLGDATQAGFWIKTPLVRAAGKGRIVNPATGKSANVDLIPLDGPPTAGSQVSLPALQMLGADLTDLPEIEVWAG